MACTAYGARKALGSWALCVGAYVALMALMRERLALARSPAACCVATVVVLLLFAARPPPAPTPEPNTESSVRTPADLGSPPCSWRYRSCT